MKGSIRLTRVTVVVVFLSAVVALHAAPPQKKPLPKKPPPPARTFTPGPMLKRMLAGPMKGVEEIVFSVRVPGRDHWYVTFGNYSDHSNYPKQRAFSFKDGVHWGYADGGRLCALNLRTGKLRILLDTPKGATRDPQVHYDGKKILFAYRKPDTHPFHLYEIGTDGRGLRQLTRGEDDDIEPTYCPDGSIVFCSSRCRRYVNCWYTRVATLYRCEADGSNVRLLSSNNDHDNTPWVLPDGRILYMRWEYVDRSQVHFHHLWTMNPDGTAQTVYYGNLHGGLAMLDAKPIPGTHKVVSSFSPGHGRPEHVGHVAIVDPRVGPDMKGRARNVSKRAEWKDPYAFSQNCFMVSHRDGLFVMDGKGNTERFYQLPPADKKRFQCSEPRPIRPRPRERIIPPRIQLEKPTGTLVLQDVYKGRKMGGVKRGSIDKLLVLKQLPKPVNFSGGMQPLTIGGSFTLAEIVGTVPVEPDGSANMELPALQSLFFVALDKQDRPVKRMHSFVTLQPGEQTSCVGCHEQRTEAPLPSAGNLMATRQPPVPVRPIEGIPSVIDFPRDVQPVLDRHCVKCHNPDKYAAKVCLTGDKTGWYTMSYRTIVDRGLVNDGRNRPQGNYEPYKYGSVVSRLMKKIDGSHHGVKVTKRERDLIRLWIETSACYPGTYAALGHPSTYPVLPQQEMKQRCGACHTRDRKDKRGKPYKELIFPRGGSAKLPTLTCNISRPEKSTVLRAPLAKAAGGLGACKGVVFKNKSDPLYRKILATVQNAHKRLMHVKRFDMPGFRPNQHYVREMKRFGFWPEKETPGRPVDYRTVDRAYWDSFAWRTDKQHPSVFTD